MAESYQRITPRLARQIRLAMTDVDGTITSGDGSFSSVVLEAVHRLEEQGIMVGLVSGRNLPKLESFAGDLGISGPIIGENGAVARAKPEGEVIDLGYSQRPAIEALEKLKALFPDAIEERDWNKYRTVDLVFRTHGVESEELRKHLEDVELLDSGYVLHLVQKGVSKGKTLLRLLDKIGDGSLSPDEVLVIGDSSTDMSLFQSFIHSVLVPNPRLPAEQVQMLRNVAKYESDLPFGEGFAQVVFHVLNARLGPDLK